MKNQAFGCPRNRGKLSESLGSRNRTEAEEQLAERKRELEQLELQRGAHQEGDPLLQDFCQEHLDRKTQEVTDSTWANHERALGYLVTYLKKTCSVPVHLSQVTVARLEGFRDWRLERVKASTVRTELSAVSSMLKRAHSRRLVPRNEAKHVAKPKIERTEAAWLEPGEAARLLQAAADLESSATSRCYANLEALIATFLLTGGRRQEVYGLTVGEVNFEDGYVHFRHNEWRGLKTDGSRRTVPLWPQLRERLEPVVEERGSGLLFPSRTGGMLRDLRSSLDTLQDKADLEKRLTPKVFRHTYTATRIQTLDGGQPVSLYTVARELGHKGVARIEDTYGHLQYRRSRLSEVRYEEAPVIELEDRRQA